MANNVSGGRDEVAASEEGGGFADYALVSLHCMQVYFGGSYRNVLDLLIEMPHIPAEIGLEEVNLTDYSTLVKTFDRFQIEIWRVLLRLLAQLHDFSDRSAIDATFFDRENANKHYYQRTNHRVQTLKITTLVDTAS